MRTARALYHVARADLLERVRRPSHLLLPAGMLFLVYWALGDGLDVTVQNHRGVYNSAWCGMLLEVWGCVLLSWAGFYVVKGAIERDRVTRVGEVLAATRLSRPAYLLGKCLSNTAILATPLAAAVVGAYLVQALKHESRTLELWPVLSLHLGLALPTAVLTAAVALLFESLPVLSGGVGNVIYFFLWTLFLDRAFETHSRWWDAFGLEVVQRSVSASAHGQLVGLAADPSMNMSLTSLGQRFDSHTFVWPGLTWTPEIIVQRLFWLGVTVVLLGIAAVCFDRFDPARSRQVRQGRLARLTDRAERISLRLPVLPVPTFGNRFATVLAAEVKLLLRGHRWWWYLAALGMWIASLCLSPSQGRESLLPVLWIWPLLSWSVMGTRERRWGTADLIFTTPDPLRRQLPALYLAGVFVAAVLGSGVLLRTVLAGDTAGLLTWAVSVCFMPAAALALGVLSGTPRAFEALFALAWYMGPLQHISALDFMWASPQRDLHYVPWYVGLTAALLVVAWVGRGRQAQ
jgi:hypothetical protein